MVMQDLRNPSGVESVSGAGAGSGDALSDLIAAGHAAKMSVGLGVVGLHPIM